MYLEDVHKIHQTGGAEVHARQRHGLGQPDRDRLSLGARGRDAQRLLLFQRKRAHPVGGRTPRDRLCGQGSELNAGALRSVEEAIPSRADGGLLLPENFEFDLERLESCLEREQRCLRRGSRLEARTQEGRRK